MAVVNLSLSASCSDIDKATPDRFPIKTQIKITMFPPKMISIEKIYNAVFVNVYKSNGNNTPKDRLSLLTFKAALVA
ncbi:MAG: hypothetical protein CMF41_07000 [Legionellales bacterium]|nr:hypothetical protein [Legionellales bacterium]OUX63543.1 MAG: hypothetical protein CBE41_04620 [Gammaproteobacteria bacterium TMED281]